MKRTQPMCSGRAGCGESRTSGSEGGGEETTGRQGRHRRLAADPASRDSAAVSATTVPDNGVNDGGWFPDRIIIGAIIRRLNGAHRQTALRCHRFSASAAPRVKAVRSAILAGV